ncbi:hypothetical protein DL764_003885 [Monosporascus ibericus]|uniref:Uncharacterized protein n=1 Tax=Monosporascus ibericus TaxID=155417 RepID=A0A4Q4TI82_9PEZI|nr:hypothetical protein DL764_003885 [Monosporascus ibericus]
MAHVTSTNSGKLIADKQGDSPGHGPRVPGYRWETKAQKPNRRLETVHFDQRAKRDLVVDIMNYQDPNTQRHYIRRTPTGGATCFTGRAARAKTSLSLPLAGAFGLGLYVLKI